MEGTQKLHSATDFALRATKFMARSFGQTMSTLVAVKCHLWLNLAEMRKLDKMHFQDAASLATLSKTLPSHSFTSLYPATAHSKLTQLPGMEAIAPHRCIIARMSQIVVPLILLVLSLGAWLALPNLLRWIIRTIRLGYVIQFARHLLGFSGILLTPVADKDAQVLHAEVAVILAQLHNFVQ